MVLHVNQTGVGKRSSAFQLPFVLRYGARRGLRYRALSAGLSRATSLDEPRPGIFPEGESRCLMAHACNLHAATGVESRYEEFTF